MLRENVPFIFTFTFTLLYKISWLVYAFDVIRGNSDKFFREYLLKADGRI